MRAEYDLHDEGGPSAHPNPISDIEDAAAASRTIVQTELVAALEQRRRIIAEMASVNSDIARLKRLLKRGGIGRPIDAHSQRQAAFLALASLSHGRTLFLRHREGLLCTKANCTLRAAVYAYGYMYDVRFRTRHSGGPQSGLAVTRIGGGDEQREKPRPHKEEADGSALMGIIEDAVPTGLPAEIRSEVCQNLAVAVLEGRINQGDIRTHVKDFTRRAYVEFPVRFGPLSLDAPLNDDGDARTLLDVVRRPAQPIED